MADVRARNPKRKSKCCYCKKRYSEIKLLPIEDNARIELICKPCLIRMTPFSLQDSKEFWDTVFALIQISAHWNSVPGPFFTLKDAFKRVIWVIFWPLNRPIYPHFWQNSIKPLYCKGFHHIPGITTLRPRARLSWAPLNVCPQYNEALKTPPIANAC